MGPPLHYNLIRNELLRSQTPQDCWYLLSHILGHIDPTETFRSYLHLAYIIAGYQLRKFDPCLDPTVIQKICPKLVIPRKPTKQIYLSHYDNQMTQLTHVVSFETVQQSILLPQKIDTHELTENRYIYGTSQSGYSYLMISRILKALDQSYTPELLSQKYDFPIKTLMLWHQNILKLKQLKNRKNRPRFIIDADKSQRILPHIETKEEKIVLEYFFKQLNKLKSDDANILNALHIFEMKANISHAGLIFNSADIRLANRFLTGIYSLFPEKYWQIAISSEISEEKLMERLQFKFLSCSMNSSLNNSFKFELVSQNNGKALTVLRYCMLVLLILCTPSQPRS